MPRGLDDETVNYHNPQSLSALSRMLLRLFWTTFVETAVYRVV